MTEEVITNLRIRLFDYKVSAEFPTSDNYRVGRFGVSSN